MNNNTLVVCGGTGAHVALALVRLHTLGQPLGFFRDADDKPLAFPTVYLVDQDSGDGDREDTAWQLTRRLVASHPGRHNWQAAIGRSDPPELKIVTPLPVGRDRTWFNPPFDSLDQRFADSPYLDLLTSRAQRDIRFSHGMMGSPAVGSLLFRLKELDTKSSGVGTNHDGAYHELLTTRGRVAVVGSAVGGTGASVAPTLAQRFAAGGDDVMAIMVLNWFRFEQKGLDEGILEKAQLRDRSMAQNANSAFAYYGRSLARHAATVPVGVPDTAIKVRRYTSDTQQPIRESFVHGVAALCGLHHFLDRRPCSPGLYQMGAEDPTRLGGGNRLPGGSGNDTVQSLANQAATLADVLDGFARALSTAQKGGLFRVAPAICKETGRLAVPERVGKALHGLVADCRGHIDWMKEVLGADPQPDLSLTREALSRERLATPKHRLQPADRADVAAEDATALALLQWTADWIREFSRGEGAATLVVPPTPAARGGYWPPPVGHDSLKVAAEEPGRLTQVLDQNILGTVQGFVREEDIAQNGWPDPMAAADHFRYAIEHEHPTERRQLEMLLAGVVMGRLTLHDVSPRHDPPLLSLDHLVDEYRKTRLPELARVAIVHEHRDGDIALGFNSPLTLFCPTPIERDERRELAWGALWQTLTGSERPRDWRTEEMGEWRPAGLAVRQIRTWIDREKRRRGDAAPPWAAQVFADHPAQGPATFGRGISLSVHWGADAEAAPVTIALPTPGDWWPDGDTPLMGEAELPEALASALESATTDAGVAFEKVEFTRPDRQEPTRAFWREHLDHLQIRGDIAAFGAKGDERKLAVLTADHQAAAILENVVLLDRDDIMVRDCTPMRQEPVPGSSTRPGRVLYPDYPLRADYLGLLETDDGRRVVDLLKSGEQVHAPPPSIDEGPRPPAAGGAQPATRAAPLRRRRPDGDATTDAGRADTSASSWLRAGYEQAARTAGNLVSAGQNLAEGIVGAVREGEEHASPGRRAVDTLRRGRPARETSSRGGEARRPSAKATWELRLVGRSAPLSFTLPVPQVDATDDDENEPCQAHWMVWPRFRSAEEPCWRAYYVYQHCTVARFRPSTLWFDPDDDRVRRSRPERDGAYPVRFHVGEGRRHIGGPPLAFSLEDRESGRELGLYVINLDSLPRRQAEIKVGLDFGTSHTVAAVQADGGKHPVELAPELDPAQHDSLVLHVSENWSHVTDSEEGLKRLGVWLPTYTDDVPPKDRQGLLPSELLTIEPLANLGGDDLSQWQPGRDCVIPFMDMQRRDLADHLVCDFKWQASAAAFREHEDVLREIYLGMAMELVMADIVGRRLRALPAQADFTFTYPLRDSDKQVQSYEDTLRRVIDSADRSLGSRFRLADGIGIYNESSAAKGGTRRFGEVCLVGDLGGGTLDLFISAEPGPGLEFEEVADSAKLGGNELLRTMAENPDLFLPPGWAGRPDDAQTQLRAWMRSKGAARLFGDGAQEPERHAGLDVRGFARPGDARAVRALISRYFRLLAEYMARSLVAYLVRHWYLLVLENRPGDHERLRVLVQLRGNGWRLWPEHTRYADIEEKVAGAVAARTTELWWDRIGDRDAWRGLDDLWRKHGLWEETEGGESGPAVGAPACSPEGSRDVNPKAAPILSVVGLAQRHEDIRTRRHALVELEVVTERAVARNGAERKIRWFDRLPVRTGGSGARVEFHRIEPPFSLSHPDAGTRQVLDDLEPNLKRAVNEALQELGVTSEVDFDAKIAPLVWESAFKSRRFVEGK